jgi:hypothetical protein
MKIFSRLLQVLLYVIQVIGVLTVLYFALGFVADAFLTDHVAVAKKEFGSPEGLATLSELYARIEKQPHDPELKVVEQHWPKYPKIREIPSSWIPDRLYKLKKTHFIYSNLYAYYDEDDSLIGIEFHQSRWGCFASRDATRCPSSYSYLHKVADSPLHVTVRQMSD